MVIRVCREQITIHNIFTMKTHSAKAKAKANLSKGPVQPKRNNAQVGRLAAYDPDQVRPGVRRKGNREQISWIAGTAYVGNGTLGATDTINFRPSSASVVLVGAASGDSAHVPVAGADTVVGVTYIRDIAKHFSRMKVHEASIDLCHIVSATTNDATVAIAPVAGPGTVGSTVSTTGFAVAGANLTTIQSMEGSKTAAAYASSRLDMTKYIRGGSGPDQNEFAISAEGITTTVIGSGNDQEGVVPCAFALGGVNSTAALRGQNTHTVVITLLVEFIDFLGVTSIADPIAYLSKEIERHQAALESHLRFMERASRVVVLAQGETATCRQLYDLRRRMKSLGLSKSEIPDAAYCASGCPGCAQRAAALKQQLSSE